MKRLSYLSTILLAGVLMAGCDALAGALGVDKVDVPLDAVGSINVSSAAVNTESGSSTRSGGKLPNVFDLESLEIKKENVKFTPASGKSSSVMQSGTLTVTVYLGTGNNRTVLGSGVATITNNVVTAVTSQLAREAPDLVTRCTATPPAAGCPNRSAIAGKTIDQLKGDLETYLRTNTTVAYEIATTATGDINGSVTITGMTLNLDF